MKFAIFTYSFLFLSMVSVAQNLGGSATKVKTVPATVTKVFIPNGFDHNDVSQVVVRGLFPNACYTKGDGKVVSIDSNKKTIKLELNQRYKAGFCIQVAQPYTQVIDIGRLNPDLYEISLNNKDLRVDLEVAVSTKNDKDDYFYASVENLIFQNQGSEAVLTGIIRNSCADIDEIKLQHQKNRDVYVMQPILKIKENCVPAARFHKFWSETIKLDTDELKEMTLFHVRSSNGQALNVVYKLSDQIN